MADEQKQKKQQKTMPSGNTLPQLDYHQFVALVDNSTDLVGISTLEGRVMYLNRTGRRMLGLAPDDPLPERVVDYIAPETREAFEKEFLPALVRNGVWEGTGYLKNFKTGDSIRVLSSMFLIRDPDTSKPLYYATIHHNISRLQEAEDALHRSEARYQAFVHAIPDLLFRIDRNGTYLDVAASDSKQLAIPREKVIGSNIADLPLPRELVKQIKQEIMVAIDTGEIRNVSYSLDVPTGKEHFEARIVRSGADEVISIVRNVTRRIETERALRKSEERLELVVEGAGLGTWDWNVQTGDVVFNERWARMLGYEPHEIKPHIASWANRVHPDDLIRFNESLRDYMKAYITGKSTYYEIEHRMRTKSGGWKWILGRGKVTSRTPDGLPLRASGTLLDIDERKQAEERNKYLLEILDATPDVVCVADGDYRVNYLNRAGRRLLGLSPEEKLVRFQLSEFHSLEALEFFLQEAVPAAVRDGSWTGESEMLSRSGKRIPVSMVVLAHQSPGGKLQWVSTVSRDITPQKEVEQLKNEFISTVSHELRTPLTSIRGALGLIVGGIVGDLSSEARELAEIANKNSERLSLLINDILDMEKIASGKMEFAYQEISLTDLVRQSIEANQPYAKRYQVSLVLKPVLPAAMVYADPVRISQVMTNFISNAAKFTPAGRAITVEMQEAGGAYRVSVTDEGPGIDASFRNKIFERFAQADTATTRKIGGTGLGLAISKGIVLQHGGTIGFESEAGQGATFYFDLPKHRRQR